MSAPTSVRPVEPADEGVWKTLYAAYRAFYELDPDADVGPTDRLLPGGVR